jgi:predicted nucleic acid-binding Zn ribbon protein
MRLGAAAFDFPRRQSHNGGMPVKDEHPGSVPIAQVLTGVLARLRPETAAGMLDVWKQWDRVVGEETARNARPAAFNGSILLVHVSSPVWIHHLRFTKEDLLSRLNAALGRRRVSDIKFKVSAF